ncbi:MAG TPA: autotransporter assembly complex family protein [Candidatus Competibacter sp.]|nr:autotransporter assembly complex family protein [Candidatus Competibacter sp.]
MIRSGSRPRPSRFFPLLCCLIAPLAPLAAQEQPEPPAPAAGAAVPTGTLTVAVEGVDGPLRDNVLGHLDINRFNGKAAPDETQLQWLHGNAERHIQEALQPFGYYEPKIESTLNRTAGGWEARYRIQPGRPIPIALVDVRVTGDAAQDAIFQKLLDKKPLVKGQTLEHVKYEQFKQNLEALATERGYFDARFVEHAIQIDLQAYEAVIRLHYDAGKRYRFGDISFKQNILSPDLVSRYPRFKPSDPYDANELLKLQGDLGGSTYFSQVRINASPDAKTVSVPVEVELEPNKRHKYSVGLGYGTDTGPRGKAKVENRWVNRQGHFYEAELQLSPIKSYIGGKYNIPGRDPVTEQYALTANYTLQNYDDQDFERIALGGQYQQEIGKWLRIYSLSLQYEDYKIGDEPRSTSFLLMPGLNWTWVDADDRLFTTRGLLFGFEVKGASTALLSDINFLQGLIHLKGIYSFNEDHRIIARGDLGATAIREDFEELPASLRFFTGGDSSVRGYAFNKIGPTNDKGQVIGGKNLLVASLEYERRLWDNWGVAVFVDAGDAFNGAQPELKTGAGVGVRWRSPVGPVRIDLATGLDRPPGDAFRFSFSIGPDL